ncbi:MAG: 3-phosphoshikimate 1-carboxyvinyltransferase [Clostridiales bacterium]|nr:3-phosphoshikimate 1-carboxyvinyltransferase [Clostridiales bacterium]
MEIFTVKPTDLSGEITAPPSKSFAHRILICAYLSGRRVKINNIGSSDDVLVTLNALKTMGASVELNCDSVILKKGKIPTDKVIIDCGESGSSLRFLMPIACALGVNCEFVGKGKLLSRPIDKLKQALTLNGAIIDGFSVSGKLSKGKYIIDGSISSQYITGLLLALTAIDGESEIEILGAPVSAPYIDITLSVLTEFGASVYRTDKGFIVKGGYDTKITEFTVEGDWSGASFFLSAGAIGGRVKVNGLNLNSVQGDRKIVEILKSFGAKIKEENNSVCVEKSKLSAIKIDMDSVPDLCQIVSVVSAFASGNTQILGVERLKIKESDRIKAIIDMLSVSGIIAEYKDNEIIIHGGEPTGGNFDGGKDHRTVMSSTVLATYSKGNSKITGAEFYTKSYPEFVRDYKVLGGELNVNIQG